jgi:hypothetical protein
MSSAIRRVSEVSSRLRCTQPYIRYTIDDKRVRAVSKMAPRCVRRRRMASRPVAQCVCYYMTCGQYIIIMWKGAILNCTIPA